MLACTHHLDAFSDSYESLTVLVDGEVAETWSPVEISGGPASAYEGLLEGIDASRGNGF